MRKGKDPDPDPYLWLMDPDPGGTKTSRIPYTVWETRSGMSVAFLGGVGKEKVDVALVVHTTLHGAEGHSDLK